MESARIMEHDHGGEGTSFGEILPYCLATPFVLVAFLWIFLRVYLWPVKIRNLYRVVKQEPGSILEIAYECRKARRDFWSMREFIFWGQRFCILTSEKSIKTVLTHGDAFRRIKLPRDNITSPHCVVGSGGLSQEWRRLRAVCEPFFRDHEFESRTEVVRSHIIEAVKQEAKNQPSSGLELFHLVNRLVLETHLIVLLGLDDVAAHGQTVMNNLEDTKGKSMAEVVDESLVVGKNGFPTYTSEQFVPVLNFLCERPSLPMNQLRGIEHILARAQEQGKISCVERLHNMIMFLVALAPSPACFWTIVHVYESESLLERIRDVATGRTILAQTIKETLRMYAPAPTMFMRSVVDSKTAVSHGMAIENGDNVIIPIILAQNDADLWENPDTYNPDRFGATVPKLCAVTGVCHAYLRRGSGYQTRPTPLPKDGLKARYFPFSMGQHTCLGQPYAIWLTMLITDTVFEYFDMEVSDPAGLLEYPHSFQRIRDHAYSFPKHPLIAKISPRKDDCSLGDMAIRERRRSTFVHAFHAFSIGLTDMPFDDDSDDEDDKKIL